MLLFAASRVTGEYGQRLGPTYVLQTSIDITPNNRMDRAVKNFSKMDVFSDVSYFEWEGYDGWFNNLAHPEWGGTGECIIKYCYIIIPLEFLNICRYALGENCTSCLS